MAASATSAAIGGYLMNWDTWFNIIKQATDDWKDSEKKLKPRYHSISLYISNDSWNKKKYNNLQYIINKKFKRSLI